MALNLTVLPATKVVDGILITHFGFWVNVSNHTTLFATVVTATATPSFDKADKRFVMSDIAYVSACNFSLNPTLRYSHVPAGIDAGIITGATASFALAVANTTLQGSVVLADSR
jgi:hypothetical protein